MTACGGNQYGEHPPYPVSGRVLLDGEPAHPACVTFWHDEEWTGRTAVPMGWTDEDGRFVLSTYAADDGAPAGDYHVTVKFPSNDRVLGGGPDLLRGKYLKRDTSGLTAHIEPTNNHLPDFELKADLPKARAEKPASAIGKPKFAKAQKR